VRQDKATWLLEEIERGPRQYAYSLVVMHCHENPRITEQVFSRLPEAVEADLLVWVESFGDRTPLDPKQLFGPEVSNRARASLDEMRATLLARKTT
jgi:hypothetical protein